MNNIIRGIKALVVAALLFQGAAARAATIQYDFSTIASIAVNGGTSVSVSNTLLSLIVDWDAIDSSGPTTTATGSIVSLFATIPANSTGFDSALLNDGTPSSLSPHFSTLGFNTSLISGLEADINAFGTSTFSFSNTIAASDPFGLNPIFTGLLVEGVAEGEASDLFTFRNYSFEVDADGSGGFYAFTEELTNTYIDLLQDLTGTESVSIRYQVGQIVHDTTAVVPVPAVAGLGLLGMGLVSALRRKKKSPQA